jgi:leucyl-tRNA synthetase
MEILKNQKEIEKKWQKIWEEKKIFEVKRDENKEKYFGTVAYPYANSILHIGHGRSYTTAEIFLRYQRLLGKNVLFPMGFHISGTPVLGVSEGIKQGDEKQIKITKEAISEYLDDDEEIERVLNSFKEPENIANFFSKTIEDSFKKIGIGIDWSRKFDTGEQIYNKFIEWQFRKLKENGILTQGKYPILYSPKEENAVGEDDIKDGDVDKVTIQEMTYILFKSSEEKDTYFVVATLRPDAIFGTTNLWVGEDENLVKIKVNNKYWYVSKESLLKIKYQFENVELISEHTGKNFIGKKVITPLINREVLIAKADFLDPKHGTGIVYSSPAGAPHDFIALKEAKEEGRLPKDLEVINTVETYDKNKNKIIYEGSCPAEDKCKKFNVKSSKDLEALEKAKQELYKEEHYGGILNENAGEFKGIPIKKAKDIIFEKLVELDLGGILYETSRRAKTRTGDDVIVANIDGQWFLDYSNPEIKQKAMDLLNNAIYLPNKLKETQKGYLEWVNKRPCARKRGLGTKLPFDKDWIIEPLSDSTIYQLFYLISHIIKRENISPENLKDILFDYLYLEKGDLEVVSKETKISKEIILEMKKEIDYWRFNDFRYVGQPHMSNHMSFLIYHYAIIFDKPNLKEKFHPRKIAVGGMLQRNGEKISKSKGNGIPLSKIGDEFGADLYRLYIATAASFDLPMDFRDDEIAQLEKKFERLKEILFESREKSLKNYDDFNEVDKWLISRFYSNVKEYFENMDKLKIREAYIKIFYDVLNDINYHIRRTNENNTYLVVRFFLNDYLKVLSPAIPHITEELYIRKDENEFISLAKFETDVDKYIKKEIEDVESIIENLIYEISKQKETKKIQKIEKIKIILAPQKRFELFDRLNELLKDTKEFKKIIPELMKDFSEDKKFITKFVPKTLGEGLSFYLDREKEKELLESVKDFLQEEFKTKDIEITVAENENINTMNLIPGKPLVILE